MEKAFEKIINERTRISQSLCMLSRNLAKKESPYKSIIFKVFPNYSEGIVVILPLNSSAIFYIIPANFSCSKLTIKTLESVKYVQSSY